MTEDELAKFVDSFAKPHEGHDIKPALGRALDKLNERVEELEQAIRSFTCEEGDDLAESLFLTLDAYTQHQWTDDLVKHRERIEKLRSMVHPIATKELTIDAQYKALEFNGIEAIPDSSPIIVY